ncbi:GAF domain-containing protein [Nocardia asteroides]|uniref:GAF domain-containing protein n=1 Tax=Nocardia asteroides TaxID=1824 RepID=UPI001E47F8A1|nr:GAF domain-containing protein [Nocardia asteroides]UGT62132.1 GAF domain-containing protein [Nocardia asteroides]
MTETMSGPRAASVALLAIAEHLAQLVPGPPLVGITAISGDEIVVAGWSSPRARLAEQAQLIWGASPGLEALRTGKPVTVPDLRLTQRWGEWSAELRLLGLGSSHSLPVRGDTRPIAVLDLYADDGNGFETEIDHLLIPRLPAVAAAVTALTGGTPRARSRPSCS